MSQLIPDRIERELRGVLTQLRAIDEVIRNTRDTLDANMGGCGRYEADAWLYNAGDISRGLAYVEKFRAIAMTKDIDASAEIARLGGLPDLVISEHAKAWMDNVERVV